MCGVIPACRPGHKTPAGSGEDAPVLSPAESLRHLQVEDGFTVQLVAAEPMVSAPIALNFDQRGRMWVVEMQGYMPDADGTGEDQPSGRIVILEDRNGDGAMDHQQVFLDSLVLPRALCLIDSGILVAEPPRLWYINIQHDRPGARTLVDSAYTVGDNVEGQANGLYRGRDNWIYNTRSEKRYRKKGNQWITEHAHLRGQWSAAPDNFGRLFYNNNAQNLLGDYFLPGLGTGNPHQRKVAGFNEIMVPDNRVYPIHPTPGVNRGYAPCVLDSAQRLVEFTAASGPVLYRGDLFGDAYQENAFVCEPAANLVKRNLLEEKGNMISGKQAYSGREFLASTDERFRPVTCYNGPDGALYVVDMYHGIIQHKSLMTAYLKNEVKKRKLDRPANCGRIYRITPLGKTPRPVLLPDDVDQLVPLLLHPNGWVRDKAQQMLVDGHYTAAAPALRALLKTGSAITVSHALWTLEGLDQLAPGDVRPLLQDPRWEVRAQALSALPAVLHAATYRPFLPLLRQMMARHDSLTAPYIAFQLHALQPFDQAQVQALLAALAQQYPDDRYVADAVISNLYEQESAFYKALLPLLPDTAHVIYRRLKKVMADAEDMKHNGDALLLKKLYPRGVSLFNSLCQTCHHQDGNGIPSLAPPLNHSEWVTGDKDKVIAILLYGLAGPVKVNGKIYKAPEINGDMPAVGNSKDIVDADIAQVLSFIRNSWNNKAPAISAQEVARVRQRFAGRQNAFTTQELEQLK